MLGFGPDNLVNWLLSDFPAYITPSIARTSLLILASIVMASLLWPLLQRWRQSKTWRERDRLELYEIAYRSVGKQPSLPISKEPELSRLRLLKDAIRDGKLIARLSEKSPSSPDLWATVTHADLASFATYEQNNQLMAFATDWGKRRHNKEVSPKSSAKIEPVFLSLRDAATRLYESSLTNNTLLATAAERLSGISPIGRITAGSPDDRLDYLATYISRHIPVYGKKPPSGILAKIAASEINRASFNDGAMVLRDNLYNKSIFWTDLAVKSDEFNSKIDEMILRDEEV